jgi:hypothetical protein
MVEELLTDDRPWYIHVRAQAMDLHKRLARLETVERSDLSAHFFRVILSDVNYIEGLPALSKDQVRELERKQEIKSNVFEHTFFKNLTV